MLLSKLGRMHNFCCTHLPYSFLSYIKSIFWVFTWCMHIATYGYNGQISPILSRSLWKIYTVCEKYEKIKMIITTMTAVAMKAWMPRTNHAEAFANWGCISDDLRGKKNVAQSNFTFSYRCETGPLEIVFPPFVN